MDEHLIARGLKGLFDRRGQFIVLGLTGRTGSGCTTSAGLLSKSFSDLRLEPIASPLSTPDQRKHRVIVEFAEKNWHPFIDISVTLVIVTFVLEANLDDLQTYLRSFVRERDLPPLMTEFGRLSSLWTPVRSVVMPGPKKISTETEQYIDFASRELSNFLGVLKKALGTNYATAFQFFGDNLRASGSALDSTFNPDAFFTLPTRVGELVVALRELQLSKGVPARIVIDALRNPFEIEYYRQRFASFLLLALTTPDEDRRSRLSIRVNLSASEIKKLDGKEYPTQNKPLSGVPQFISQNIQACLEKADVFVKNPGAAKEGSIADLKEITKKLVTFVCLVQHPGLVTPTKVERCMQIAYSARANSGCISRQVGAAITDGSYSVKAVGWNDVPAGQVPCLFRNVEDLLANNDEEAFSDYELNDERFRSHMEGRYKRFDLVSDSGRSSAFCFKSEYNSLEFPRMKGNQVHTRALHAEENAFLQLSKYGGGGIEGGILFSTASPCELCSKKAYQLGIKKIYFIDPYPGISLSHILSSGPADKRPTLELFSGAIGQAFHRLYDPLLPYKDEVDVFLRPGEQAFATPKSS
ncbi:MAG: deoxycytidylate deaminase [Rubrivivax sp.]|nr:MAG: deoxycytidylate deaminase [Rubrivivax sp.]